MSKCTFISFFRWLLVIMLSHCWNGPRPSSCYEGFTTIFPCESAGMWGMTYAMTECFPPSSHLPIFSHTQVQLRFNFFTLSSFTPSFFFSSGTFFFLNAFLSSVSSVLSIATNYSNLWVIAVRRAYSTVFYQAGHSKLSKELALIIRFPNQPHHHPLPSPGPTGRATSIFFWKPSCLVKLDSFAIGIKRHKKCINSACPHVCSRKASSVCLCVKWIRKGSMRGRLSLRVLTKSCCLREAPVSYLTGDDVLHTQLSETWMHLCQWLVSLSARVLFFYTHSHILISLLAWKFFWANSCPCISLSSLNASCWFTRLNYSQRRGDTWVSTWIDQHASFFERQLSS